MTKIDPEETGKPVFEPEKTIALATRALVIGPYALNPRHGARQGSAQALVPAPLRMPEARLSEAKGLAAAIDLQVVAAQIVPLRALRPATYIGQGKVEDLAAQVAAEEIGLVVFDCALSPVQQRNLEQALRAKVIDRTGLILEIFGRRASTREGRLQVELAHLAYQKSRLVRSWTHLERQRGGFGFLGGPGETQIETDRRLIQERMARLERDLGEVKRTRALNRTGRDKVPYPTVALVGYTNAGKSSLFNVLTHAEVLAKDMLFATLDPTTRALALPHGLKVVLSDTVGFISDLPTQLIAAFRATLEDVTAADLILHVRDIADPQSQAQEADVRAVLAELGLEGAASTRLLEVWNKADLLLPEEARRLAARAAGVADKGGDAKALAPVLVSVVTGQGIDALLAQIERRLAAQRIGFTVSLPAEDGAGLAWLYAHAEVLARKTRQDKTGQERLVLQVRLDPSLEGRLRHRFPQAIQQAEQS